MPTITLTLPVAGQNILAGLHSTNYANLQTLLNGGLDNTNIAAAAGIVGSKLATDLTGPPGTQLAYTEFTAPVTITATTEAGANTVVTAPAITFDGATPVVIEFFAPIVDTGAAGQSIAAALFQDGSSIGRMGAIYGPAAAIQAALPLRRRMTPASGSRTYSIRVFINVGTGTVTGGAGGSGNNMPGYIRITKA